MTFGDAARTGVRRLRRPEWNDRAYLRIDIFRNGHGPWATLFDVYGRAALRGELEGYAPKRILILGTDPNDSTWQEYAGTIDPLDEPATAAPASEEG